MMATESIHKRFVIDENNIDFFVKLMTESHPTVIEVTSRCKFLTREELQEMKDNGYIVRKYKSN